MLEISFLHPVTKDTISIIAPVPNEVSGMRYDFFS
jgi:hypothetical protein